MPQYNSKHTSIIMCELLLMINCIPAKIHEPFCILDELYIMSLWEISCFISALPGTYNVYVWSICIIVHCVHTCVLCMYNHLTGVRLCCFIDGWNKVRWCQFEPWVLFLSYKDERILYNLNAHSFLEA